MSTVDLLASSQDQIKPRSYFKQAVAIKPPKRAHTPKRFLSCMSYEKGYTALLGVGFFFLFSAFNAAQVSLTDPLQIYFEKQEIKLFRYY
jgi:hypothetical protein